MVNYQNVHSEMYTMPKCTLSKCTPYQNVHSVMYTAKVYTAKMYTTKMYTTKMYTAKMYTTKMYTIPKYTLPKCTLPESIFLKFTRKINNQFLFLCFNNSYFYYPYYKTISHLLFTFTICELSLIYITYTFNRLYLQLTAVLLSQ